MVSQLPSTKHWSEIVAMIGAPDIPPAGAHPEGIVRLPEMLMMALPLRRLRVAVAE